MKVVHLNTSDVGGAGIAAKNLHLALLEKNIESTFVSKFQLGDTFRAHEILKSSEANWFVPRLYEKVKKSALSRLKLDESIESYYLKGHSNQYEHFSFPWSDLEPETLNSIAEADIIHLHWISDGFIDPRKIFKFQNRKFVWTLHDMNPFTGGCHHNDGCEKFENNCNYCYQLNGTRNEYLSYSILKYKYEALRDIASDQLNVVTPSIWLGNLSKKSAILKRFDHHVIRNMNAFDGSDINVNGLKQKHKIDEKETVFIFVAHHFDNPRKGISILMQALEALNDQNIKVIAIGEKNDSFLKHDKIIQFGYVKDKTILKELYTLADAFILPSKAENFPNTIVESLLCGTPVIASNVGGISEQITAENGLLVNLMDVEDWKQKLTWFIANKQKFDRSAIKQKAKQDYNNETIVEQHIKLYEQLLKKQA
ncbi:MAG: glycosyltransferase [Bacteroidota bacterium]|nr:glycosyltransferase [Bacteroidota bacterium]